MTSAGALTVGYLAREHGTGGFEQLATLGVPGVRSEARVVRYGPADELDLDLEGDFSLAGRAARPVSSSMFQVSPRPRG
jgi:hypothetical protein